MTSLPITEPAKATEVAAKTAVTMSNETKRLIIIAPSLDLPYFQNYAKKNYTEVYLKSL
jgi:hypothetical protein